MANAVRHPLAAVKQFSQAPVANTAASEPVGEAGSVAEAVREQIDGLGGIAKERLVWWRAPMFWRRRWTIRGRSRITLLSLSSL